MKAVPGTAIRRRIHSLCAHPGRTHGRESVVIRIANLEIWINSAAKSHVQFRRISEILDDTSGLTAADFHSLNEMRGRWTLLIPIRYVSPCIAFVVCLR